MWVCATPQPCTSHSFVTWTCSSFPSSDGDTDGITWCNFSSRRVISWPLFYPMSTGLHWVTKPQTSSEWSVQMWKPHWHCLDQVQEQLSLNTEIFVVDLTSLSNKMTKIIRASYAFLLIYTKLKVSTFWKYYQVSKFQPSLKSWHLMPESLNIPIQ